MVTSRNWDLIQPPQSTIGSQYSLRPRVPECSTWGCPHTCKAESTAPRAWPRTPPLGPPACGGVGVVGMHFFGQERWA